MWGRRVRWLPQNGSGVVSLWSWTFTSPMNSDAVHKCRCTTRADVQWIHWTRARAVKKNLNFFFGPFSSLFHPLVWHSLPEAKTIFPFKKSKPSWKKHSEKHWRHRNDFALVRGLLYTSSRNGYQSYSEKYAHGWESVAEGGLKNLLVLWF
jgi:hypothetical protein